MSERTLFVAHNGKLVPRYIPKLDLKEGQILADVHSVGINPLIGRLLTTSSLKEPVRLMTSLAP